MTLNSSRQSARRALWIVLGAGLIGWALFILARVADLLVESGRTSDELWGPDATVVLRPSTYLIFAAIAVVTIGALLGRRAVLSPHAREARLVPAVRAFASTVIIIGLVLAALGAVVVFLTNFYEQGSNGAILTRVLGTYLPIVLYTALVIFVILNAFVFAKPSLAGVATGGDAETAPAGSPAVQAKFTDASAPSGSDQAAPSDSGTRNVALAFTLPIVAVAVALVFGLIVYDLTRSALESWMWVIVQGIIAAGIIAGTVYSARAVRAQIAAAPTPLEVIAPTGVAAGARTLNLVLSIVFAASVTILSLVHGSAAVQQLHYQPSLWLSAYSNLGADESEMPVDEVVVSANGSGLKRCSEVVVTLKPGGIEVAKKTVDTDGNVWLDAGFGESTLAPGNYELSVDATVADGSERSEHFPLTVTDNDIMELPDSPSVGSGEDVSHVIPPSASWVFGDMLPAALLFMLVIGTLAVTIQRRNPDE